MDRSEWIEVFNHVGYSIEDIIDMEETDFQRYCEFFVDSGLVTNSLKDQIPKESTNEIRRKQDEEYEQALKDAEEKDSKLKETKNQYKLNKEKFNNLPPEPKEGIKLAFQMPSGKRLIRMFDKESLGEDLYVFIGIQEELYDKDSNQISYLLIQDSFKQISRKFTLDEQNISNRTLIRVVIGDD